MRECCVSVECLFHTWLAHRLVSNNRTCECIIELPSCAIVVFDCTRVVGLATAAISCEKEELVLALIQCCFGKQY